MVGGAERAPPEGGARPGRVAGEPGCDKGRNADRPETGANEGDTPAGHVAHGGEEGHPNDGSASEGGDGPAEGPATGWTSEASPGDRQRQARHGGVGKPTRQAGQEQHPEGWRKAGADEGCGRRDESEDHQAAVAVVVGEGAGKEGEGGAKQELRRDHLAKERNTDTEVGGDHREEGSRGDERQGGDERAEAEGGKDPTIWRVKGHDGHPGRNRG